MGHKGKVWVADMNNHRIAVFSLRGRPLRTVGSHGTSSGQFRYPAGVAVAANLLLVSEYIGGRIQVFSSAGVSLQVVHMPFRGSYVCALSANERRVTVTDTRCRLHM